MLEPKSRCLIYEDRPKICRDFPTLQTKLKKHYLSCTYWFDELERKGECSRCGECCELNKVFTDKIGPCPYLRKLT